MNNLTRIFVLFAFCSVVIGRPDEANGSIERLLPTNCAATVSAFPPDPKTECCGVNGPGADKLIGGLVASIDEYPWLALIEFVKNGNTKTPCGGVLISGKYVLTGAQYFIGPATRVIGKPVNVLLGEYDISNEGRDCEETGHEDCTDGVTKIPIEVIIPHPGYDPDNQNYKNDIALIKMTQLAPYTDFIRPICLPTLDITTKTGPLYLKKGGWGYFYPKQLNSKKQRVKVPLVAQDVCQKAYGSRIVLWKGQLCAGGENIKDFCKGDAGLPLMYENSRTHEVTGIVSLGPRDCQSDIPTIYTNVYEYVSWIKSNITP